LQILVSSGTDLHAKLESFLDFNFVQELPILDVSILKLSHEVNIEFIQLIYFDSRNSLLAFIVDKLKSPVDKVPQIG
jgi:hypothetical protein